VSYATLQNMRDRIETSELVQLTDEAGDGVIDEGKLTAALNDASDLMDTYIGAQYALPLATVPTVLVQQCVALARYNLYKNPPPEHVVTARSSAIDWLKSLAQGKAKLDVAGIEAAPKDEVIAFSADDRRFTRRSLRGL
jgi:phage gp36-like protein